MSISTMRGDGGETSLAGGIRVSKSSIRVDAYGTIDELNATLGFARSICPDLETERSAGEARGMVHPGEGAPGVSMNDFTRTIQQDLFRIGSALATPPGSPKPQVPIELSMAERLTAEVHRLEALDGILSDWSVSGEHAAAAAFDVARTVCRRAERAIVRLAESGEAVQPGILAYINRLSDLLWLFGRKLERDAGVSGSLRARTGKPGNRFSRAW